MTRVTETEIARKLGISRQAVSKLKPRALEKMKRALDEGDYYDCL
ncbi:sigma factor-like helix-turn-helix DNA-binding protein [Fervidicola ferrireducens]